MEKAPIDSDKNATLSTNYNAPFDDVDEVESAITLTQMFREKKVWLGGSSMGKGFRRAAQYYLNNLKARTAPEHFNFDGASDLNDSIKAGPVEESFYVIDLGVIVSQFYQWRLAFPRVEPFYAVKCNPDPLIVKTLAILGANFDCASRAEIRLVQDVTKDLPRKPEIIYANPCKARGHMIEAVCRGVRMVTFDNVSEIAKCAAVSTKIQLIMRIVTDDKGSQCRLSSKFGAHRNKWRPLLAEAKRHGLQVVGVSFHVGSGCRDASRYEMALRDTKEIFDIAKNEFGYHMNIVDIGGGFPGETHSIWNPAAELDDANHGDDEDDEDDEEEESAEEGVDCTTDKGNPSGADDHFMFFNEIAEQVGPLLDEMFPEETGIRLIAEPGRYFAAAAATLVCSIVSTRNNVIDSTIVPIPVNDQEAAERINDLERVEEEEMVRRRGLSICDESEVSNVLENIKDELADYSRLYTKQYLSQQEADVYNDALDLAQEGYDTAIDLLGVPDEEQQEHQVHTVEGLQLGIVSEVLDDDQSANPEDADMLLLAAAGEATVNGLVLQAVADSAPLQDDFAYYINDGCYGAFNNLMYDHATVRPRRLKYSVANNESKDNTDGSDSEDGKDNNLYASTVFGPTCDSIDVISRSVLLPKMKIGDWLYFQNMGAYTMAAASSFNGFSPSDRFYVSSVKPEYFEKIIAGPDAETSVEEEKKENY